MAAAPRRGLRDAFADGGGGFSRPSLRSIPFSSTAPTPPAFVTASDHSERSAPQREGKGSEWRSANRRRQLQTRTPNSRRHANPPPPTGLSRDPDRSSAPGGAAHGHIRTQSGRETHLGGSNLG